MRSLLVLFALVGCGPGPQDQLVVHVQPVHAAAFRDFLAFSGHEGLTLEEDDDPANGARGRGLRLALIDDLDCEGCFRVDGEGRRFEVHGGGVLGLQYGLTWLFEQMGFRFPHPLHPVAPEVFLEPEEIEGLGVEHAPQIARRGLHLHTLHPIEGLYDFWLPETEGGADRAKRVIDWVVRNRGNHVQWVGLDDISASTTTRQAWQAHTAELVDYAHERGVTTGLGVQLFGTSNLQKAFDLIDDPSDPEEDHASTVERLEEITEATDFDLLNLSFGEFFAEEPDTFVSSADAAYAAMQEVHPGVDVTTVIHVGNYDDLRVEYQGEELLYYFLVKYANPAMVPWVHSVMYYNLFEDAGGAYLHEEFDEHRDFLLERLAAGEPVGYFPETAYWVAFDINVPIFAPLYVRSRWLDLDRVQAATAATGGAPLSEHVLFSSGWEWGYWLNDAASLRMSYELPADWSDPIEDQFAPWGDDGAALAEQVVHLAEVEHAGLLEGRLAAYLAGREQVIDLGGNLGIVSQPDRPAFEEVAAYPAEERAAFEADVLLPLAELASEAHGVADAVAALDTEDRWFAEMGDGAAITAVRADFAVAVWSAAARFGEDGTDGGHLAAADAALAEARIIVDRRHADLHWPDPRITSLEDTNPTAYPFGYLARAQDLCFWERERAQVRNLVLGEANPVPGCAT